MKYSGVILSRNEQHNIASCIANIQALTTEVLVIDDNSTDDTPTIAQGMGAIVFQRPLRNDWARQRNFGMELAESSWVLMIDADERFDSRAKSSLARFSPKKGIRAARLARRSHFNGQPLNHFRYNGDFQYRALSSDVRYDISRPVHELPLVSDRESVELPGLIEHYWTTGPKELFEKWARYSEIEGRMLANKHQPPLPVKVARHLARIPVQHAYLDGWAGLINVAAEVYGDFVHTKARRLAKHESHFDDVVSIDSEVVSPVARSNTGHLVRF